MFLLIAVLSGCATPYQTYGDRGGYEVIDLSEPESNHHSFQIHFCGNKHTSIERVYDYSLLRAAELAVLGDDKYFCVVAKSTHVNHTTSFFDVRKDKVLKSSFSEGSSDYTISEIFSENRDKPLDLPTCYIATEITDRLKKKYWLPNKINKAKPPTVKEIVSNHINHKCYANQ